MKQTQQTQDQTQEPKQIETDFREVIADLIKVIDEVRAILNK